MTPRAIVSTAACAVVTALVTADTARAQDDAIDRTPQDCVSVSRIRTTHVVDDRTILFYMRGRDQVYLNELPRECPRLATEGRFAYETRVGRLCEIDTITVLESFGGRFQRGATCRLGAFHPITEAEAAEIEAGPERARDDEDVDVEEVELPDDDEEEGSGGEPGESGSAGGDSEQ